MFDLDKVTENFLFAVASVLLGCTWIQQNRVMDTYMPPSKEQVIYEYQNNPIFNSAVDMIVSLYKKDIQDAIKIKKEME